MTMYKELFRIDLVHQYFSGGGKGNLTLRPVERTRQLLQGQQAILKATGNGVMLLVPMEESGVARLNLLSKEVLTFEVFSQSNDFHAITDLSDLADGEILGFSNAGLPVGQTELPSVPTGGKGPQNGLLMVATVKIHLSKKLLTIDEAVQYKIAFEARSEKWRYYFVTDNETTDLRVEDRSENLQFNNLDLEGGSPDKIGTALNANFPEANVFLFESETAIPFSDQVLKNLQLFRDGHVLIKHLPNPETKDAAVKIIKIQK